MEKRVVIACEVPKDHRKIIEAKAEAEGLKLSDIIRKAIKEYCESEVEKCKKSQ